LVELVELSDDVGVALDAFGHCGEVFKSLLCFVLVGAHGKEKEGVIGCDELKEIWLIICLKGNLIIMNRFI
jgi:hypothetical protein